jgi:hypothetical protein
MGILDGILGASSVPSSPTGQTTTTSTPSIQPWAQPYISNYLNATQNLIANQQTPALLNQSYQGAANLTLPSYFAKGAALAQAGGQGSLANAPIALGYGAQGAEYGAQAPKYGEMGSAMGQAAARAGDLYAQQATNPEAIQGYMNPYIQQALKPQLEMLNQQQQIDAQMINAGAANKGAFGGNRATLAQGLSAQNYDLARQQAIGQGYNQAFQQAQQAQQFGANLGLQGQGVGIQGQQAGLAGLQTAMQGSQVGLQGVAGAQAGYGGAIQAGGTLGNIGAQESQAKLAQLALQNQFGQQQQLFPYQQQQFAQQAMANLPFTSTTQTGQVYQAPPNTASQLAGIGQTALGATLLYKAMGASGGLPQNFKKVKSYASGGIAEGLDSAFGSDTNPIPMGQMAPTGAGLAELIQARQNASMGAGMGPAFGGSNEDYVNSLYQNIFGRQADQGGYQHNLDLLNSGKINAQDLAGAFRTSAEGQRMPQPMPQGMGMASGLADIRLNQLLGAA